MSQNSTPCRYFNTENSCKNGISCSFSHTASSSAQPQQKFSYQQQRVAYQPRQRVAYQPRQQTFQNHPSNYRTVMCRYLTEPNGCKYSDKCKFSHSEKNVSPQENHEQVENTEKEEKPKQEKTPEKEENLEKEEKLEKKQYKPTIQCRFFGTPNGCNKGDTCTFKH